MATDAEGEFLEFKHKADEYHKNALWQEKLRALQDALAICEEADFPNAQLRRQQVLYEIGGIRRRFGQHDQAVETLDRALAAHPAASPKERACVLGELGVVYRHNGEFSKARELFREQYRLVRDSGDTSLEAEAEVCRAIGNEGMAAYNLAMLEKPPDRALLETALDQLRERITRARIFQARLLAEAPTSKYVGMSKSWETIGMDRLSLVLVATGDAAEAVKAAKESQDRQSGEDPTVSAWSRFYYGNALWYNGQRDEALQQWNAPNGQCSSAMVFCKEPAAEHVEYVKLMAAAGVDFDTYDEQGFSALDYATFSDTEDAKQTIRIIVDAIRGELLWRYQESKPSLPESEIHATVEEEIAMRLRQAKLRRAYRAILQEHLRPVLRTDNSDSIEKLRTIYAELLPKNPGLREMFDAFHFVKFSDFRRLERLPLSTDNLAVRFPECAEEVPERPEEQFIIFFSYRWLGWTVDPPQDSPDDRSKTQWHRMMNAIEEFLKKHRNIDPDRLGLWLVSKIYILSFMFPFLTQLAVRTVLASTKIILVKGIAVLTHCH